MTAKNYYHVDTDSQEEMSQAVAEMANQVNIIRYQRAFEKSPSQSGFESARGRYYARLAADLADEMQDNGQMAALYNLELGNPQMAASYLVHKSAGIAVEIRNGFFEVVE